MLVKTAGFYLITRLTNNSFIIILKALKTLHLTKVLSQTMQ